VKFRFFNLKKIKKRRISRCVEQILIPTLKSKSSCQKIDRIGIFLTGTADGRWKKSSFPTAKIVAGLRSKTQNEELHVPHSVNRLVHWKNVYFRVKSIGLCNPIGLHNPVLAHRH
jgi:hypothetical protein